MNFLQFPHSKKIISAETIWGNMVDFFRLNSIILICPKGFGHDQNKLDPSKTICIVYQNDLDKALACIHNNQNHNYSLKPPSTT